MSAKNALVILCCGLFISHPLMAQPVPSEALDITADSTEYLSDQNKVIARGNVQVRDAGNLLQASYMILDTISMDLKAVGNVVFTSVDQVWRGDEFTYNLRTKQGDFGHFSGFYDPFYITAESSKRVSSEEIHFYNVIVTTCEGNDPAVSIHAKEAFIKDNRVTMKGAVFYAANAVPFMYVPSYSRSLGSHERFFQLLPGYSSRLGFFVLNAYNYPVAGNVRGITHFDFYSNRGVGLGQDFAWKDKEGTFNGIVQGYYIQDSEPLEGPGSEGRTDDDIDEERYRIRLAHTQQLGPRDTLIGEMNYLSDPYVLQDFFQAEYRYSVQPENRLTLTHRGDEYTAAIQLNTRLNDFYENVNRLPELSLDVPRKEIFDSGFYYETRSAASYLERVYPEDSDNEDYSAYRIDSDHTIYYPTRHFGFLNLIPRAGYRATYYSETFSSTTVTNPVIVTDELGDPVVDSMGSVVFTNVADTTTMEEGAGLRHVFQLGWEASFKAFKTWNDYVIFGDGDGARHIIEPYLDHTYVAEPNYLPDELPQFDSIDTIDEEHVVKLGLRNKLQTRRNKNPVDIVDLDLFTFYRVEKDPGDEDFSDLFFDSDFRFVQWIPIEVNGSYDMYESEFIEVSTEIHALFRDKSRVSLEHLYQKDSESLLGAKLNLFPEDKWSLETGVRYDFEDSELEEHYYFVRNRRPCVSWGLGFRQIDEDEQIWLQLWLTAFPEMLIDMGN